MERIESTRNLINAMGGGKTKTDKEDAMGENKFETTQLLLKTLQSTRQFEDLRDLRYQIWEGGDEIVEAEFENGFMIDICVTADSCLSLIKDVIKGLE